MTAPPFLTFPIRGKKDAIRVRQRARQIAALLQFSIEEQACVAAGTFAVARQALLACRSFAVCFQVELAHLHVYACVAEGAAPAPGSFGDAGAPLRLAKRLPGDRMLSDADLGWLVEQLGGTAGGIFDEIAKQNEEVLTLLHALYSCEKARREGGSPKQNAA